MAYDVRKINHGTQEVTYGDGANGGSTVTYSTGIQKFAVSVDQDTKDIFADARTHMTLLNPKKLTIEIDNLQYTGDEMEQMGFAQLQPGAFTDSGSYPTFAVQRILDVLDENGEETKRLEVYYGVKSGTYTESDDEDSDEINPKVYTRTLTVAGYDFGDGVIKQLIVDRTTANATVFDSYKTKIITPSMITA